MKRKLWINGKEIDSNSYYRLHSPYDDSLLAEVAIADLEQVNAAISSACMASKLLREMPAHQRASILEKVVELLTEQRLECAQIISNEASKPIRAAIGEVDRTIMTYKFAANEARNIHGETIPLDGAPGGEGRMAFTIREPLGVIGAITPFNFPMNLVAHKVGPAIAAGNAVVLKPASQTPMSAYKIAEFFHQAGLPAGALNVITGSGKTIGDALVTDDRMKMITFTGSPSVGKRIREKAGLKKVTLELGSNSAVIIDKNINLSEVVPRIVTGSFVYQGQVCISVQRIYVHEEIVQDFANLFVEETKKLTMGHPSDESTDISSMISKEDVLRAKTWIDEAVQNGARLLFGGDIENNVLCPTVLFQVKDSDKVSCEEIFAPVVSINSISSIEEGIERVNSSKYGLQAGIYTKDIQIAFHAAKALEVGGVMINDFPTFRVDHMPYGGVKESGTGREGIRYAVEEMTELKLISFKL
ncbi:aldehyde dehydrogenase family protein [Peribacillus acanthi]|uniref:aldehyde dehydrogenase family protein n=1 Tax=Peribacillus acanthi TaxID=2171554 RepID=UPI000D3E5D83|nr:aldehyde dehydrogenase family protein [Peribacillus acanthi]